MALRLGMFGNGTVKHSVCTLLVQSEYVHTLTQISSDFVVVIWTNNRFISCCDCK